MAGQSMSTFAQFGINSTKICFREIDDQTVWTRVDDSEDTMCGSLDHDGRMVQAGITVVQFIVRMRPSPQELQIILPYIGFSVSGNDYTLATNFQSPSKKFTAVIDKVAKVSQYANCMVRRAIFDGARGFRSMGLELHIVGEAPTFPGSFTPTALSTRTAGFPLTDGVLTLEGAARRFNRFVWVIDNFPSVRWNNSINADSIEASDRLISLSVSTPYTSDEIALLDNPIADASGESASLIFTRGSESMTVTFNDLVNTPVAPKVPHREEIRLAQNYRAYKPDGSTDPIDLSLVASS